MAQVQLLQWVSASAVASFGGGIGGSGLQFSTQTVTFTNPVTAGSMILVMGGGDPNGMFPAQDTVSSISDSASDSFTQILNGGAPRNSGPTVFCYLVPRTGGGSSFAITVTEALASAIFGINFPWMVVAAEFSVPGVPIVQSSATANIFGAGGNDPQTLAVTDSLGNTVSVTYNRPGFSATISAVDLVMAGIDFLFGFGLNNGAVPTADHGYTFVTTISDLTDNPRFNLFTPTLPFGPLATAKAHVQYVKRHMAPGH